MGKFGFITTLFFLSNLSFATVELADVTSQFFNMHGTDWTGVAKSDSDWQEIRNWHEKIIEEPTLLSEIYPQPGMVDYLLPIAIHSYGQLIGQGKINFDDKSQALLGQLSENMLEQPGPHIHATVEALAMTNSVWALSQLRQAMGQLDSQYQLTIYSQIEDMILRLDEDYQSQMTNDLDLNANLRKKIAYKQNKSEWDAEIYNVRKEVSKLSRQSDGKKHPALLKLNQSLNVVSKKLYPKMDYPSELPKDSLKHVIKNSLEQMTSQKIVKNSLNETSNNRQPANSEDELLDKTEKPFLKPILILLLLILTGLWFFKRFKER